VKKSPFDKLVVTLTTHKDLKKQRTLDNPNLTRKEKWREIIFEANTPDSRLFDVILLWAILSSVVVIMLDSVQTISVPISKVLIYMEWFFTILFSIEYFLRIYLSRNASKYILSFWGIIDLISTIPTYLSLFFHGTKYLLIIRVLRLLRVFRIFRLSRFSKEASGLGKALRSSSNKIIVFFGFILVLVILMGTLMYIIEGAQHNYEPIEDNKFSSIPASIYWAVVTVTTVGYGDITPQTILGKFLSSALMIIGYAIITVPTGIVTVGYVDQKRAKSNCTSCETNNDVDALFCKNCGESMNHTE
jgi:voltage-gated potassium channel